MAFPTSPSDEDEYTNALGTKYKYDLADDKWYILGTGISEVSADTTPQLGGALDTAGNSINDDTGDDIVEVDDALHVTGNITTDGTVDGVDIAGRDHESFENLVEDTTPQLGGPLDLNSKPMTEELTAAVSLVNGDLCYLNGSGEMAKADASAEATCDTLLAMCTETISASSSGTFIMFGRYTTTGLTAGAEYFASETAGAITLTKPTTTLSITRHVGSALSTTVLWFDPDKSYFEHV